MASSASIRRDDAARLLGVSSDADAVTVRRAFRAWAALAHPDHGGNAQAFADLCRARDILLSGQPPQDVATAPVDESPDRPADPPPRRPWTQVMRRPTAPMLALLAVGAALAVLSVVAGTWVAMPWGLVPAALLAAAWCCAAASAVVRGGDAGHVIVARSLAWSALASAQIVVASLTDIAIIDVLPVMALPFVMVIAAVNPGAGLWRVAGRVNVR